MSVSAYKKTIKNTETPRDIERRIISQVTTRLTQVQEDFDAAEQRRFAITNEIREAVYDNQRLWITLKADLMAEENKLSPELRADLISLSMWVDKQCTSVLNGEGTIAPLIEVNQNIINGLSAK
ncbi:flagellar biosynthesis regulator FlaF [Salipiger mucosus]|uniref:FlaF protein n=1 Tax=Salipiger mucosus DSM 16094 TaxID=1123237 RepID=S9Q9H7_9RHOB|nr:flagellar biosynthesis regulator FlaF [Salipiger mucosus]EPX78021.1 flaF protein [Salipiger mucosus DSM 16094]